MPHIQLPTTRFNLPIKPRAPSNDNQGALTDIWQKWSTLPAWQRLSLETEYPELFAPPMPLGPKPNKSKGWLSRLGGKLTDWAGNSWGTAINALSVPADISEKALGFLPSYIYWNDLPDGYSRWEVAGLMYDISGKAILSGRKDARRMRDGIQRDMEQGVPWDEIFDKNKQTMTDAAWKLVVDPLWLVGGLGFVAKAPGKLARLMPGGKALLGIEKSGLVAARATSELKLGQAGLIAANEGLARMAAEGIGKESVSYMRLVAAKSQSLADIAKAGPIAKANTQGLVGRIVEWGLIGGGEAPVNLYKSGRFIGLTEKNIPVLSRSLRIGRAMLGGKPFEQGMEDAIAYVAKSHAARAAALTEGRAWGVAGPVLNWMMRKNLFLNKAFKATSAMQEFERFGMSLAHDPTLTPLDYAMTWGALMEGREALAKLPMELQAKLPQEYLTSPVTDEMSKILQQGGLNLKKWRSLNDPDPTTLGARFLDDAIFGTDGKSGHITKIVRDFYGMAESDPVTRLQGHVKSLISLTTLNRPAFVVLNAVNNLITVAWHEGPDMFRSGITKRGMLKDISAATGQSADHISKHIIEGGVRKLLYGAQPKNSFIRNAVGPFIGLASEMDAWARIKAWQLGRRRGTAAAAARLWTRPANFHLLADDLQANVEGIRMAMAAGGSPYELIQGARRAVDAGYMPEAGHALLTQYLGERYGAFLGQLPEEQRIQILDSLAEPFHDFAGTLTDIRAKFPGYPELAKAEFDNWLGSVKYEDYRLHLEGGLPPINEAEKSTGEMLAGIAIDEHRMGMERTNRYYSTLRAAGVPEHVAEEFRVYQASVYNELFEARQGLGTAAPQAEMVSQAVNLQHNRRALKSLLGGGEMHPQDVEALREMGYNVDNEGVLRNTWEEPADMESRQIEAEEAMGDELYGGMEAAGPEAPVARETVEAQMARAQRELEEVYTPTRIKAATAEDAARGAAPPAGLSKKVSTKEWQNYFTGRTQRLAEVQARLEEILDIHARDKLPLFAKLHRKYIEAIAFHDAALPAAMRRGENIRLGADMGPTRREVNKRFNAVVRDLEKQLPLPKNWESEMGFPAADNLPSMAEAQTLSNQVGVDFMHWSEAKLMEDIANPKVLAEDVREGMITWLDELQGTAKDVEIAGNLTGHAAADYIMLNYNRVGNLDTWSMWAIPYLFWPTRSMQRWSQRMFANPGLMASLAKVRGMTEELNENLPDRLRYQMKIPFPFIGDLMNKVSGIEGDAYFDPLKVMFPFMQWSEDFSPEGRQTTLAGRVLSWWGNNGPGVSPLVPLIGSATGALEKDAWLTRTWPNSLPFGVPGTPAQMAIMSWVLGDEDVPINNFISEDEKRKLLIGAGLPMAAIQRVLGMDDDRFDMYRIDRAMQDLLLVRLKDISDPAEKQAIVDDYLRAMWNRDMRDPLWQEARKFASKEMGTRTLTSWLAMPISIYPEGEMQARSLQPLYNDAAENDRLEEFFERFPEFRVRRVAQATYTSEKAREEALGTTLYYMDMATSQATMEQTYRERDAALADLNADPRYFNTKLGRWYRDMIVEEYAARIRDDREAINQIVGLYGERKLSYKKAPKMRALITLTDQYWSKSIDDFLPTGKTADMATDEEVNTAVTAMAEWRERFILQLPAERLNPQEALAATVAYYGETIKAKRAIAEGADYDETWAIAHAAQDEFTALILPSISRAEFQTYLERNLEPPSKAQIRWEQAQEEMAQYTFVRDELKWPKKMLRSWWAGHPMLEEHFGHEPDPYTDALPGWAWDAYAQVMRIRDDYYGKPSTVQLDYLSLVAEELNYYLDRLGLPVVQLEQSHSRLWDVTISADNIAIQ